MTVIGSISRGIAIAFLSVASLSGLPIGTAPAVSRDQVVIAIAQEPVNLSAIYRTGSDTGSDAIGPAIFAMDVDWDAAWRPFPQGVGYLPSIKDGTWKAEGERMTLLWRLRPRNWHDGRPVTCGDYVFALRLIRDPRALAARNAVGPSSGISSVSCPAGAEGREVWVNWQRRNTYANLAPLPTGPAPRHLIEPLYRQRPERVSETFGLDPPMTVGDGAYRLLEWHRGEYLTLEAVPEHAIFGTPRLRRITYRFILDPGRAPAALLAGTVDALSPGIPTFENVLELERRGAGKVKILVSPPIVWEHIDFNLDNPLLRDVRVRRAIAHGINRTEIVQQLFQGRQLVAHTYLSPRHDGYTDALPRYPYDPARAQALLREAGFTLGPDGIMRNAAGQRFSIEFNTTTAIPAREQVQEIIRRRLRQVGIEVNSVNYPRRVFFTDVLQYRRFTGMVMFAWFWDPRAECETYFGSDHVPVEANDWTGANYSGYRNREMDEVCTGAARELDPETRTRLLQSSARIFARDLPALPLYYRTFYAAAKVGFENFTPRGFGWETWNAHTWYWK